MHREYSNNIYVSQSNNNEKAELSQRWPPDAPYVWVHTAQCPENFRESLTTPMVTFSEIFNGFMFRLSLQMCMQNLKFVALPVPEIIGVNRKKLGSPWIHSRSLFSKKINGLLFVWTLWMCWLNLKSVAFPVPEITGTWKNWAVPGYAHAPFSPKFFMGFCSDGPCYCSGQIWSS